MMPILRHEHKSNYTTIPNSVFKSGLSLKGIGLLCLLISLPENWEFSTAGLCAICSSDGRDSICKGLKELEASRYLVRSQRRTATGKTDGVEWVVSDVPLSEKPKTENPEAGNPNTENPPQESKHGRKNRINKGHKEGRSPTRSRFEPPTIEEVRAYCQSRGNNIDPERFVDYYRASGWKRNGNVPVKDWQACVRNWERREKGASQKAVTPDYTAYQEESL